jgi:hypothetical protein
MSEMSEERLKYLYNRARGETSYPFELPFARHEAIEILDELTRLRTEVERLKAELDGLLKRVSLSGIGHNQLCYYCKGLCNALTGNPGEWPLCFTHPDEPGKAKWHHVSCVQERLAEVERLKAERDGLQGKVNLLSAGHCTNCIETDERDEEIDRLKAELTSVQEQANRYHQEMEAAWSRADNAEAEVARIKAELASRHGFTRQALIDMVYAYRWEYVPDFVDTYLASRKET